jgi:uncharacterized Zn-binding protein involved in type VI secretion
MSGYILDKGATVMCMHGAQAQPTTTESRVKINGQPVVTQSSSYTISGCQFLVGQVSSPCTTAQWTTTATRVKAGGQPVVLQDSQATCVPNGTGLNIVSTQTRVKGT